MLILVGTVKPIDGNVRSIWYQRLKPFYRRHNLLATDLIVTEMGQPLRKKFSTRGDRVADSMSLLLAEIVYHRVFCYLDLGFAEPFNMKAKVGRGRPRTVLITEKEGLWSTVSLFHAGAFTPESDAGPGHKEPKKPKPEKKPLTIKFPSISAFASNGQPSLLALEYFAVELKKKTKSVRIGALVDMNPYGYEIALAYTEKFAFLGFKDVKTFILPRSDWFTPEQVAEGEDFSNCPTPGEQTLADKWFAATGGVHGQKIGVDVDVVGQAKLMLHIYRWVDLMEKTDGEAPGYIVLTVEDVIRYRRERGIRGRLIIPGEGVDRKRRW
jgi:hypothetical protein